MTMPLKRILECMTQDRLGEVFGIIRALITDNGEGFTYRIDELYETYRQSLIYLVEGVEDPERQRILDWTKLQLWQIALELNDSKLTASSHARYYTRSRHRSVSSILRDLPAEGEIPHYLAENFFDAVWTSRKLGAEDFYTLLDIEEEYLQSLILSALLLALDYNPSLEHLRYFIAVLRRYVQQDELRARAVTALAIGSAYAWWAVYLPELKAELKELLESDPTLGEDIADTLLYLYQSRGTRSLSDELKKRMDTSFGSLAPEVQRRLSSISGTDDEASVYESEELRELVENSGIGDEMQQMARLFGQGYDVFFGQFTQAKMHPYFRNLVAWFAPLSDRNSLVADFYKRNGTSRLRIDKPFMTMCDSDAYSLLAMLDLWQGNADLVSLLGDLSHRGESVKQVPSRQERMRNYVNGLYRFFQLYDRKGEHTDIFTLPLGQGFGSLLPDQLGSLDYLERLAGIHLEQKRYPEAISVYQQVLQIAPTEARYYEALASAQMQIESWSEALRSLSTAELIVGATPQIVKSLARCHASLGNYAEVVRLLRQLLASGQEPKPAPLLLRIATAHIALAEWSEALSVGYEYEIKHGESRQSRRIIAYSLLSLGRFCEATEVYRVLLSKPSPTESDRFNAAHSLFLQGQRREALELYRQIYQSDTPEAFLGKWAEEQALLKGHDVPLALLVAIPEYLCL